MKCYSGEGVGRTLIIELDRGEDVFDKVEEVLLKEGIKNAYIASAVGSIAQLEYHRPKSMDAATEDEFLSLEGPFEFGGISGTIIDGVAHFHFSAGGTDGLHIGHLERGTKVLYLLELVVVELKGLSLKRMLTPEKVKKLFPISE
ncbi:MAG TPA: DNA-binding protein [Candidatus Pelethocola excrementipullorum]|nr:DNA-binding protein [Candidatus Pelethocola excrementipullorum]